MICTKISEIIPYYALLLSCQLSLSRYRMLVFGCKVRGKNVNVTDLECELTMHDTGDTVHAIMT